MPFVVSVPNSFIEALGWKGSAPLAAKGPAVLLGNGRTESVGYAVHELVMTSRDAPDRVRVVGAVQSQSPDGQRAQG